MKTIQHIFVSLRPNVWTRIAGEMFLGAALSPFAFSHLFSFFLGFILVGPFTAGSSYLLNDISDKNFDIHHALRKDRPVANGLLSKKAAYFSIFVLYAITLIASYFISIFALLGIVVLIASEVLYTMKPFRWKEIGILDILLNGINAAIRFILGFLFAGGIITSIPLLFLLFGVTVKIIFFLGHRWQNKKQEMALGFKSTATYLSGKYFGLLLLLLITIAAITYIMAITTNHLPEVMFLYPFLAILLFLPFSKKMKEGMFNKEEHSEGFRNYLYVVYLIFAVVIFLTIQLNK